MSIASQRESRSSFSNRMAGSFDKEEDYGDFCKQANDSSDRDLIQGQLYKYTNVMKGWQYRWFCISMTRGTLEYYMPDDRRKTHPRACVYLAGSVISPSEEDSQTFTVSAACGEVYKLKAADAKERQFWVNKLRQVAYNHEMRIAQQYPPLQQSEETTSSLNDVRNILLQTQKHQRSVVDVIEKYTNTDETLLLLKATSHATVMALEQCFAILQAIQLAKI
ncbi:oxysterol-binding protein-related protein 11-like protein [Dinothrombium tinctorium]|uniref:Oxysterol-binding protein-related protein 11-like protein n=1 Tax=Dinothrombium tinctorium TaxID=1965070 RepID=A0A443RLA8_9ACAR|nr:oxysterol-binding protein-related protein 11-like protein [Dinothrombium tinctorium]RWS16043.1 oxysterol-binding protein-related protein 11-like protein [Dinothrombium tinctorium]